MSHSFHSAIPSFSPCFVTARDTFSNEDSGPLLTVDALSDWIYVEGSHYISYSLANDFKREFIAKFNDMMLLGHSAVVFDYLGQTTYTIVAL